MEILHSGVRADHHTYPIWVGTHLQYDFAIHLSQLEKVEGTDSISLAVLRTQNIAILAGLMMRVSVLAALERSKHPHPFVYGHSQTRLEIKPDHSSYGDVLNSKKQSTIREARNAINKSNVRP